eukprot:TRINITY_DN89455_c0_g1_i1.p1 TRINITY_DN89455_c0_g1~~TRINITY_DN89455_c0_g1_i1.p1  ORF type:complete len:122 (-),score=12.89 TRINITY_DN89455_c0_g1_i1:10-375(-)
MSPIIRLISSFIKQIPMVYKHFRSYEQFWRLLLMFAKLGPEERAWMVSEGMISKIIDFYMDTRMLVGFNQRQVYRGEKPQRIHPPNCEFAFQLLAILIQASEIGRAVQQECRDRSRMPSSA